MQFTKKIGGILRKFNRDYFSCWLGTDLGKIFRKFL